jgi:hypothetical protein
MTIDPFKFLSGPAVAAKWPMVGYVVEGTVTGFSMDHQKDYDTNEPLYWRNKSRIVESAATPTELLNPVVQMKLDIQGKPTGETWEGLSNIRKALPDDDGARTAYVKGALQAALKTALRQAGAKLEKGAYVRIERVADGEQADKKKQAPHNYRATWTPAAQNAHAAQSFLDETADPFAPKDAPF